MEAKQYPVTEIRKVVPHQPGVYFFYNKEQAIIYVGKAKNLKKRVSSYFNKKHLTSLKTQRMVEEITSVSFTIVNSEYEALLLENNLIKTTQPRYNILLKDDKTYPYICITKEPFPRVIVTRQPCADSGHYYGPFTDIKNLYRMLELIRSLYTIRTCSYNLTPENIRKHKFKVCLEYHMKHCKGPCEGRQTEESYNQEIAEIETFLKGNMSAIKKNFKEKMYQAAQMMDYKDAQSYKEKITALDNYQAKSTITNPQIGDMDVFAILSDIKSAFISYLQIKEGAIIFTQTTEIKKQLDELDEEILPLIILHFREKYASTASEALVNLPINTSLDKLTISVPKIGDKRRLVELAIKNALFLKKEALTRQEDNQKRTYKPLELLQKELRLKSLPLHIECFDNSNIQGAHPVAAMVVFKNGKPAKKEYRHFNIKTVVGPDDFASMREVVGRRYTRLIEENQKLPDLIVIDGGKGQLSAAVITLQELGIYGQVAIIGIAKRLEEIYYPEDSYPLHLSKQSPALKLLQQIRNEAHRFAITFHRDKRSKASFKSQLDIIPGIGPKTITTLLQHFGSVQNIKEVDLDTLAKQIGHKKAIQVKEHLK
ncbi:MAG: excinuclease ABC subunit C [Candidatus Amoebophilus sp. 36-38]|nr:MAG: excinuclease ABC subunit C [Candidatus Amoebophilus sp. 36-38]